VIIVEGIISIIFKFMRKFKLWDISLQEKEDISSDLLSNKEKLNMVPFFFLQ
jgi:hypothetical protein